MMEQTKKLAYAAWGTALREEAARRRPLVNLSGSSSH